MIGIVIVANGNLADELLACVENILDEKTNIRTISLRPDFEISKMQDKICSAIEAADTGDGVVVVTDIHGSSPANLSLCACHAKNHVVLSGMNMPMLLKLVKSRRCNLKEATKLACDAGQKYIGVLNTNG